jgi:uncharacterized protein (DUF58 family)
VLIVLDPQPEGSLRYGAKQDLAISFVITLIRALWRESYRVTFACHGEEFFQIELAHRRADFHMLLRHLAEYHSRGQQSLKGLIERVRVSRQRQMSMILVTDRVSVGAGEFEQAWTGSEGLRVISTNDPGFGALFQTTQGMVRW